MPQYSESSRLMLQIDTPFKIFSANQFDEKCDFWKSVRYAQNPTINIRVSIINHKALRGYIQSYNINHK